MFHQGKLGWRFPRPNDYAGPDKKPLRDTFGNLQQFMTWPHCVFSVDGQAYDTTFSQKNITATEDPYQLIVGEVVQVPRDFDRWWFTGTVGVEHSAQIGRHILGWWLNGAQMADWYHEIHFTTATANHRLLSTISMPVRKGDTLSVATRGPGAGLIGQGRGTCWFLPMG